MKNHVELPGKVEVHRVFLGLGVLGLVLGLFRFLQLFQFADWALITTIVLGIFAFGGLLHKSSVVVQADPPRMEKTVSVCGLRLLKFSTDLSETVWVRARPDVPDLVVEAGTRGYITFEVVRFKNAYGKRVLESSEITSKIAAVLNIEDKGYREVA